MWRAALESMRLPYWVKNILVIVPLFASGSQVSINHLGDFLIGFIALSFVASAGYVLNDLNDLDTDSKSAKFQRPIASGRLRRHTAVGLIVTLVVSAAVSSLWMVGVSTTVSIVFYFILSATYSLVVRRKAGYELIFLGLLHSIRIWVGFMLFDLEPSFWLLALSVTFFTAMASAKRFGGITNDPIDSHGRGYDTGDSGWLLVSAASLFYASLAVYGIYLYEKIVISATTIVFLWGFLAFVLFMVLIQHLVISAHRSLIHSDAVSWLLKNKQAMVILCGLVLTNILLVQAIQ